MGRGIIGKSKGDVAMDKMIKHMERSAREQERKGPQPKQDNSIVAQLKALYPETWKDEFDEMILEQKYPEYLSAKRAARAKAKEDYYAQPRRDRQEETEHEYVRKAVNKWKAENRERFK